MRWTRKYVGKRRRLASWLAASGLVLLALFPAPAWQEKRFSVYTPQVGYTLTLLQRDGREYIDLGELLRPLGRVQVRKDGRKWLVKFDDLEGEFTEGKTSGRMAGSLVALSAKVVVERDRPWVPVDAAPGLVSRVLDTRVDYHPAARRVFVGNAATRFVAEAVSTGGGAVVLTFTAPVSPSISTERNALTMTFTREPVISAERSFRFDTAVVTSASYAETNGGAEITLAGKVPLLATPSSDGRIVTIGAAPRRPPVASTPLPALPQPDVAGPPPPPGPPGDVSLPALALVAPDALHFSAGRPRFLVVVDAAHGGEEPGAALTHDLLEKDVTLAAGRLLRQELQLRGIPAALVRDGDATVPLDDRARMANAAHATVYVALHAGTPGHGVRVYTSLLTPGFSTPEVFLPWEAAQAGFVDRSRLLAQSVVSELGKQRVDAAALQAPVRPLNNVAAVAVAVEVAPPGESMRAVLSATYLQSVARGVAAAIFTLRAQPEGPR